MLKEWACEFFTLVAYHIFGQGFANSSDSFTVECIKKHNFLVIDIFLILHNLLVNKFLFTKTRLNGYHAAGKKGKVSLWESLLKHVYSLHANEFISRGQCIITPGFSLVYLIRSWNRKSKGNLPLLQRRLHTACYTSSSSSEMFLVFLHASPHLQPLEYPRDIRTQVHRRLIQLLELEHPQNANCKHDADTSSWFISCGLRTPSL